MWVKSVILTLLAGAFGLLAVRRLRQFRLKERYAILFVLIGLPFIALALWQDGVGWIAQRLGIAYQTVTIMALTVFFIIAVLELLTILSVQDRKITTLAQLVGILSEQQRRFEQRVGSLGPGASPSPEGSSPGPGSSPGTGSSPGPGPGGSPGSGGSPASRASESVRSRSIESGESPAHERRKQ